LEKKNIQNKTHNNKENGEQIWHNNKLKSNAYGWNWKQDLIGKRTKKKQKNENQIWHDNQIKLNNKDEIGKKNSQSKIKKNKTYSD